MGLRLVLGCSRDATGRTTEVCNPSAAWSPRAARDVIDDIIARQHVYVVFRPPLSLARIRVAQGPDGAYLRTSPDGRVENNLDRLPACTELPGRVPVRVRRNAADLSQEEWGRYVTAVSQLLDRFPPPEPAVPTRGIPPPAQINWWFKQDQIHAAAGVHDSPIFLPWHRELVNRFEALLQEIDPEVTVPYWDWTTDPRATPDRTGRRVDLMTETIMGSDQGEIGPPFERMYTHGDRQPTRDNPGPDAANRYALPPRTVRRRMPRRGIGPRDARPEDYDWSDNDGNPRRDQSGAVAQPWVPDDREVLARGYGSAQAGYDLMRLDMQAAHGWAHRYIGGDVARADGHYAFRDPFAFLIHSNVDRLWSSWQLRQVGDARDAAWGLDPARVYGDQADSYPVRNPMIPWSGGRTGIWPWTGDIPEVRATDPSVVRPTLYDRYAWDDDLCCSWATLLLGRKLPNGDVIQATIERDVAPQGSVTVRLVLNQDMTWWKGIRVPDGGDSLLLEAGEDGARQAEATVPTAGLENQILIFHKRVQVFWFFNTDKRIVYRLTDLSFLPDQARVTFTWLQD